MKSFKSLLTLALFGAILFSCEQEPVPQIDVDDPQESNNDFVTVPAEEIVNFMNAQNFGASATLVEVEETQDPWTNPEVIGTWTAVDDTIDPDSGTIYLSITDFSSDFDFYNNYLSGKGFPQGTQGVIRNPGSVNYSGIKLVATTGAGPLALSTTTGAGWRKMNGYTAAQVSMGGSGIGVFASNIPELAGWEYYDNVGKNGMLLLGYRDRFGISIGAEGFSDTWAINKVVSKIDWEAFDNLAETYVQYTGE